MVGISTSFSPTIFRFGNPEIEFRKNTTRAVTIGFRRNRSITEILTGLLKAEAAHRQVGFDLAYWQSHTL
ncbi:hypothetical protein [Asticcacaulis sp. MM231]|uniref:hypothetical protein n=1 Tax=Asticcacaulis sp. MM231 TaxID=3157666 RepID=UPI0032D576AA